MPSLMGNRTHDSIWQKICGQPAAPRTPGNPGEYKGDTTEQTNSVALNVAWVSTAMLRVRGLGSQTPQRTTFRAASTQITFAVASITEPATDPRCFI